MDSAHNVEYLVNTEPWRSGQGRPSSQVDSIWARDTLVVCDASTDKLQWEAESDWWWCRECGHCSNLHVITHYIAESPSHYYNLSLEQFYRRRETQGFPQDDAVNQALHITGVALRVAASKRPEDLAKLAQDILALAS